MKGMLVGFIGWVNDNLRFDCRGQFRKLTPFFRVKNSGPEESNFSATQLKLPAFLPMYEKKH